MTMPLRTVAPAHADTSENHSAACRSERFVREVMPYSYALLRKARQLTRNDADAEDLTQETLLRAYAGFGRLRPDSNIRAWLYRIQTNTWISNYHARIRRPAESLTGCITDEQLAHDRRRGPAARTSAEAAVIEQLPHGQITAALHQISEAQRTVIYLADVEGLPYKVIAQITGTPLGTVMSRLHRARRALRGLLTDYGHHCGYLRSHAP
ncbi:sigma-70 family RNA polymerase sigma factor [Mycolicibacterium goodii]|uniref:RNA polymerase sigma factor n=1 Tax=Mycolicibacterium goodii TaxID=134601 RepID=A0ABS6HY00_MYCGD|nr:sigma-70 family RNA polymerase sigma factor [Mycolicibacterium goodii]MBU8816640.1 sigma-70 family RNA polymerase sigma factor [Mycolicibacterium goodii]MBU8826327.1 sigma-70 family RNA polymerase sigma factor [Mycolicibacterium goodii]MBU8839700.1 sigma-70 family RNA polymerase sigma factor [Mycolicibacterium goodii]